MRLLPKDDSIGWAPYAWVVYVALFAIWPALKPHASPTEWALTIGATVLFLALYFRGYWVHGKELLAIIVAITLLGILFYPTNYGAGSFFIFAAAFAAWIGTRKAAIWTLAIIETIVVAETIAAHVHPFSAVWPVVFVLLIGGVNIQRRTHDDANIRLRLAHDEIARLAKMAERERIARDLHDLLGHTLSLIVLKSELASKLSERDPERARAEIREVERISREALAEVRVAVRGYRSRGLQPEIDEARETLRSAGLTLECEVDPVTLPPAHEAVLALAIREGVTNVVRHAGARLCTIRLRVEGGACTLTIADDGRGLRDPFGAGLAGMRERVESLGGSLICDGAGGTTLTITTPLPLASIQERTA
jgi:two-component system sensor histidine kinase DesK